jgi:polar amino acid transport system substrate-binding protein
LGVLVYDVHHDTPHDNTFVAMQQSKVWRVGIDISDPPFASEPDGHTLVGFDIDLAHTLAERLGVQLQIKALGYDGLYDALKVGTVDSLISALSINPAYYGDVIYSTPYFDNGVVIASTNPLFQHMADLDGKRVAVEYGSTADQTLRLWARRLHWIDVQHYPATDIALDAARAGQADAALGDAITIHLYSRIRSGLTISADSITSDPYAIAVRRDSPFLADAINKALDSIRIDGTLDAIIARWL